MKPYPKRKLRTREDVRLHYTEVARNLMENWFNLAEFSWHIALPEDEDFHVSPGAGISVTTQYPYKKVTFYVQEDSVAKSLKFGPREAFFANTEKAMIHECLHIIFARLSMVAERRYVTPAEIEDAEEEAVDRLSNAIYGIISDYRVLRTKKKK